MAGLLGALAGGGMLMLSGILFFAFLLEVGAVDRAACRCFLRLTLTTVSVGCLYFLFGALVHQVLRYDLADAADYTHFFRNDALVRAYEGLEQPGREGFLTHIFVLLGHGVGRLLLGQYASGGWVTAWGMTCLALCLLYARLRAWMDEEVAGKAAFMLLCLPGSVFFFLPGWPPLALLLLALIFYFAGKGLPVRLFQVHPVVGQVIAVICMLSSACVTAALAISQVG
ncbi:MAG: hypothetical protein IJ189_11485 [Clostridia bacterium]|nr:hypothetical protein [Clostridia bacterium]